MADLLVHFATAFVPARALQDVRLRAILYVGVCLPDLAYKGLLYLTGASTWACEPSHSPLAMILLCYAAAMLFEEAWRARAFGALYGGTLLHLVVDLGKSYLGAGVIPWAFPFSMARIEVSLYRPEDTLYLLVPAAGAILLAEAATRLIRRTSRTPGT